MFTHALWIWKRHLTESPGSKDVSVEEVAGDWKDRSDLYMRQQAVVRIADGESEQVVIGRGVRQGCTLSQLLFSIYAKAIMLEAMERIEEGV